MGVPESARSHQSPHSSILLVAPENQPALFKAIHSMFMCLTPAFHIHETQLFPVSGCSPSVN